MSRKLSPPVPDADRALALSALGLFLVAQLVGLFLRALPLLPLPVNYTYVLYSHTHVALTGWVQALFYLALMRMLPEPARAHRAYGWIWRLNLLGTIGMLISFPFQGYKAVSIACSSAVILVSYAFAWRIWRDSRPLRHTPAWRSIRISLLFLLLCSLGPWSLGFLMVRFPGSDWLKLAVYFYLHFLYNGFFSFALLGVLLGWAPARGQAAEGQPAQARFWPIGLLALACLPAYALSTLWTNPPGWVWGLAWLAAGLQLIALIALLPRLLACWKQVRDSGWVRLLLGISLLSLVVKLAMQTVTALPMVALPLGENRYLIIAYLHLVFLGMLSCFLFAWLLGQGLIRPAKAGFGLLLAGMAGSEALLFGAGAWAWLGLGALPQFSLGMLLTSALMPLGTGWLLWRQRRESHSSASFSQV